MQERHHAPASYEAVLRQVGRTAGVLHAANLCLSQQYDIAASKSNCLEDIFNMGYGGLLLTHRSRAADIEVCGPNASRQAWQNRHTEGAV